MSGKEAQTEKHTWFESIGVYLQWPIVLVFFLGIASGFPLLLTASTLMARLKESDVDIQTIGIFASLGLPYTLKFLAAPIIDALHLPGIKNHLAHRKSWCALTQICLVLSLLGMAYCDPRTQLLELAICALLTSTFSALQDIVIDALRIEILPKSDQGAGSAAATAGYRIGMLLAGAGAFVLASFVPWNTVYCIGAGLMALCLIITLCIRRLRGVEEALDKGEITHDEVDTVQKKNYRDWIKTAVVAPITDFFKRPSALNILLFIALFKLGDAMAGSLSMPFYLELGFTKIEIAGITKVIGVVAVLAGTFVGGSIVKRFPIMKALTICGTLQILSNFVFVWLAQSGNNIGILTACIVVENVTGGMGTAAFVAYMSQLCNVRFTATQYALFTSLSSIGRTLFASGAGFIVAGVGWSSFYVITAVLGLPGMGFLYFVWKADQKEAARIGQANSDAP